MPARQIASYAMSTSGPFGIITTTLSSGTRPSAESALASRAAMSWSCRFVTLLSSKTRRSYSPNSARFLSAREARFMRLFPTNRGARHLRPNAAARRMLGTVSASFVRDLRAAAAAGVPIVCVVSHEERRARALVGEAFRGTRVFEWTATRGWSDDASAREPLAAIERAGRSGEAGVARVMLDLHPWLTDARVVRALRDAAAGKRDVPLVLVMPMAAMPPELDRDCVMLALALPDAVELAAVLDAEMPSSGPRRDALVRAAQGLTLDEARRAFRVACASADADAALRAVIAEKRGALRRSACLELVDAETTLDDVGGLDVLK